jgi:AcrR family transcriptional regulator
MSIREEKKKKTKRSILEAAISLFNENGYDNTSIEQISKNAGVGKGTIYSYFDSKKSIIKGFCEYELEKIHHQLVAQSNEKSSVLEQMLIIFMTEFDHVTQNPEFGRLYLRETMFPDNVGRNNASDFDEKYFEILFPILKKGQQRGELREDIEHLYLCAHFYSLYIIVISAWYSERIETSAIKDTMKTLFKQTLDGLQPVSQNHTTGNKND